jgi:Protein of unknown function (DUF1761)
MLPSVNWLHVIIAAITGFIIGMIFYLPPLMGNRWRGWIMAYAHLSESEVGSSNPLLMLLKWLVTVLLNSYVLAGLFSMTGMTSLGMGLMLAIVAWLGFAFTLSSWDVIFAKQPIAIWLTNNAGFLLMQIAMTIVLILWK